MACEPFGCPIFDIVGACDGESGFSHEGDYFTSEFQVFLLTEYVFNFHKLGVSAFDHDFITGQVITRNGVFVKVECELCPGHSRWSKVCHKERVFP